MPVNDGSGFGYLSFRKRDRGQSAPSRLGFWSVFGAVLLALSVQTLVVRVLDRLDARRAIAELADIQRAAEAEIRVYESMLTDAEARGIFANPAPRTPARPVPAYPGHVSAKAQGAPFACISGRIYQRVSGGWNYAGPGSCRATSE